MKKKFSSPLFQSLGIIIVMLAGCSSLDLTSRWKNKKIDIDGRRTEWGDTVTALDDHGTAVGMLVNDDQYLYIGLSTTNRDYQRQIMRGGLTIWFDRNGGEDKKFGVHYPMGFMPFRGSSERQGDESEQSGDRPPETRREYPDTAADELEIYGSGENDHHRMTFAETGGIEAKVRASNDMLIYEIKVPLADNGPQPFAIGAKPGSKIGVGLETISGRAGDGGQRAEGGEGRGGGMGGRGGGMGGRGGGGGRRGGG